MFDLFVDDHVAISGLASDISPTIQPLLIGRRDAADGRDFSVDGRIDEAAIWTRALSDRELATLYNNGRGTELPTAAIPEPSALLLMGAGGLALLVFGRRRPKAAAP